VKTSPQARARTRKIEIFRADLRPSAIDQIIWAVFRGAQQCEKHFIESLSLDEKAVFNLSQLPNHHRDPFDRMLVCQAIAYDLTILTSDELIMQYPVATAW